MERIINSSLCIDKSFWEKDQYTFSVLKQILNSACKLIITEYNRFLICYSCAPYPVWIWTADDILEKEMDEVYQIVKKELPPTEGFHYNMKYDFAEKFIKRAASNQIVMQLATNMYAYDCKQVICPVTNTDGAFCIASKEDIEDASALIKMFHEELNIDKMSDMDYQKIAEEQISAKQLYLWKNKKRQTTAICICIEQEQNAAIQHVYTLPNQRRNHYASHLVYEVTKRILKEGKTAMLYTDADYYASNACYEKLGYILQGKLCTIGCKQPVKNF